MESRVRYLCIGNRRGMVHRMLPAASYRRRLFQVLHMLVDVRRLALDDRQGRIER